MQIVRSLQHDQAMNKDHRKARRYSSLRWQFQLKDRDIWHHIWLGFAQKGRSIQLYLELPLPRSCLASFRILDAKMEPIEEFFARSCGRRFGITSEIFDGQNVKNIFSHKQRKTMLPP